MDLALLVAVVGLAGLIVYVLTGGADFGGGIWHLMARGPRAAEQRDAIARAIGPIWEANHVWLIFLIVILFSCFPPAFAALCVALFIPFHLVLVGVVLRGAAFVFRAHGATTVLPSPLWTRIFGVASSVTPLLLGMCLASVTAGHIRIDQGHVLSDPLTPWTSPFCWALGALTLSVCAYIAAIYLTLETEGEVQEDFRRRGLYTAVVTAMLAGLTLLVARSDAPRFFQAMMQPQTAPLFITTNAVGLFSLWAVYSRRYRWGRLAVATKVTLVVLGWGMAQQPYLIYPDVTLADAASPEPSLRFFLWTLVPGGLLLVPSLALLFWVFKGMNPAAPPAQPQK
jgi:cytochrome bd ubiquinol oxidase subunit II